MSTRRSLTSEEEDRLRFKAEIAARVEFAGRIFNENAVKRGRDGRFAKKAESKKPSAKDSRKAELKEIKDYEAAEKAWDKREAQWMTEQEALYPVLVAEREALIKELHKYGRSNPAPPEMVEKRKFLDDQLKAIRQGSARNFPEPRPPMPASVSAKKTAETKEWLKKNAKTESGSKKGSKTCNKYPDLVKTAKERVRKAADSGSSKEKAKAMQRYIQVSRASKAC